MLETEVLNTCENCGFEVDVWISVEDNTVIPYQYEDCRSKSRIICVDCLSNTIRNWKPCIGNVGTLLYHQDVGWRLFPQ